MDNNEKKLTGYQNIVFSDDENILSVKQYMDNHEDYIKAMQKKIADIQLKQASHIAQSIIQLLLINIFGVAAFLIFINIPYYIKRKRYKKVEILYNLGTKLLIAGYISIVIFIIVFIIAAAVLYIKFN